VIHHAEPETHDAPGAPLRHAGCAYRRPGASATLPPAPDPAAAPAASATPRSRDLTPLSAATLAVTLIGLLGSLAVWVSGRGAAAPLCALFALGALYQGIGLLADSSWPLPADPALLAEAALFGVACAGLVALWTLRRTTRERDQSEDLHWDSMEVVRGLGEAAGRSGASFDEKITRVLELGSARFELTYALAAKLGSGGTELLAWRAPEAGPQGAELAAALEPRLRLAAEGSRAVALRAGANGTPAAIGAFLGASARLADGSSCVLAFAGAASSDASLTATDKDLCLLLAQWLRGELELRSLAAMPARAPSPAAAVRVPDPHDLNDAVRRSETRLRTLVAADATLELTLAPGLPGLRPQRVALDALVESLVVAAHGLAPSGALRIETSPLAAGVPGDPESYATLAVRVRGAAIDADAMARAFADPLAGDAEGAALPLAKVESLLRRAGGDLSVQVEPGRGAVLTAYLPGRRPSRAAQPAERAAESVSA
jgi:hypothetical protein